MVNAYTIDWGLIYELSNLVTAVTPTNDIFQKDKIERFPIYWSCVWGQMFHELGNSYNFITLSMSIVCLNIITTS